MGKDSRSDISFLLGTQSNFFIIVSFMFISPRFNDYNSSTDSNFDFDKFPKLNTKRALKFLFKNDKERIKD